MTQGKLTKDDLNPQFRAEIVDLITNGNSHIGSTILSETGEHGIRYWENKLSVLNNSVWQSVTSDAGIKTHIGHLDNLVTTGLWTVNGPLSISDGVPVEIFESDKTVVEVFAVAEGQVTQRLTIFGGEGIGRYSRSTWNNVWVDDPPSTSGVVVNGWIRDHIVLSDSYQSLSSTTAASSKAVGALYETMSNVEWVVNDHVENSGIHVTPEERATWNDSSILSYRAGLGGVVNFNDVTSPGFYKVGDVDESKSANVPPVADWSILTVFNATRESSTYIKQEISTVAGDAVGTTYHRMRTENVWSPWIKQLDNRDYIQLFQSASDVKTNVASAITAKGISTSPTATGAQMAANIGAIPTGKKFKEFFIPVNLAPGAQQEYTVELGFVPRYSSHQTNGYFLMNSGRLGSPRLDSPSVMDVRAVGTQIKLTIRNGLTTQYDHPGTIHYATD